VTQKVTCSTVLASIVRFLKLTPILVCKKGFSDGSLRIEHRNGLVIVSIKDVGKGGQYEECFKLQADLSYEKLLFVSALSGKAINNYHYVTSIKASNLDT